MWESGEECILADWQVFLCALKLCLLLKSLTSLLFLVKPNEIHAQIELRSCLLLEVIFQGNFVPWTILSSGNSRHLSK